MVRRSPSVCCKAELTLVILVHTIVNIIKVRAMISCAFQSIADFNFTGQRVVAAGLLPILQREVKLLEH